MKRIITLAAILTLAYSCEKEPTQPVQPTVDCNCDRYIAHSKFSLIGNPIIYFGDWTTINDCTGLQLEGSWSTGSGDIEPVNGQCK